MMRHMTDRERELLDKFEQDNCSDEEKKKILEELNEIDKKESGPFG